MAEQDRVARVEAAVLKDEFIEAAKDYARCLLVTSPNIGIRGLMHKRNRFTIAYDLLADRERASEQP